MSEGDRVSGISAHADVDVGRRAAKARKILAVLDPELPPGALGLLEVGTGSGVIANQFAEVAPTRFHVQSVDVVDRRVVRDSYDFTLLDGTSLHFPDAAFDVVISNHMLEPVGKRDDPLAHLGEIARVLQLNGVAYLATPNRWTLMERHFKVPLLSSLPARFSDLYLRAFRRGQSYDCRPIGPIFLSRLVRATGLRGRHFEVKAMWQDAGVPATVRRMARTVGGAISRLWMLLPTFVVLSRKSTYG